VRSPLLRILDAALDAPGAPPVGAHVLVAASGGPDSTALLAALAALAPARRLTAIAGHVDHALRGAESAGDRTAVEALAVRLGVACVVRAAPLAPGAGLEARARTARHRALAALAAEAGASVVALAHTEDDQVETVLFRLLRGAGRRGLGGMRPRTGRLWRPLLGVTRADVRRYLADENLPFRLDRTNADLAHARNRLRRLVVPLLAREFNPRLGPSVAALAARLRDEDELLEDLAAARLRVHRRGDRLATAVATEPPALARRVVRAWLDGKGPRAATARHVERVLALARGAGRGYVAVPGPGRVGVEGDVLVRRPGRDPERGSFRDEVAPGAVLEGPDGAWRLALSAPRVRATEDPAVGSPREACFDADLLALPLVVRSVARGDRIVVPGVGTRKLQDVLVDAKVPRERRWTTPIVTDAHGRVLWVAGIVRGAEALVTNATIRVLDGRLE
jgi:tRNA(Ile)-lysidine synthase